jgi:hypothetical protein
VLVLVRGFVAVLISLLIGIPLSAGFYGDKTRCGYYVVDQRLVPYLPFDGYRDSITERISHCFLLLWD